MTNLNSNFDFSIYFQPGLYKIVNKINKKFYIGESSNIAARLTRHQSMLQLGIHDNKDLQKDWQTYGFQAFSFEILEIDSKWADDEYRKEKEFLLLNSVWKESNKILYNKPPRPFVRGQKSLNVNPILINDVLYSSLKEASKNHQITEAKALRLLTQESSDWSYLTPEKVSEKRKKYIASSKKVRVYLNGQEKIFESLSETGRFYNLYSSTIRKRIISKNFPGWTWADSKLKIENSLNQDKQNLKNEKEIKNWRANSPRCVLIENQRFSSMGQAAYFFGLSRSTIRNRCLSKNEKYKYWVFVD